MTRTGPITTTALVGAVLAAAPAPARAGPAAAPPAATPEHELVIVTATRTPQRPRAVGASVTVLTDEQLRTSQTVAVADRLREVPGVSVNRNGGAGAVTSVRIRGAEADQTVVLVDGIKLNDPSQPGGGFDFAGLLVGDLDRIEVLRGPQSTLYGSQAIGGVVNLVSRTPVRPLEGFADLQTGGLATTLARGAVRGRSGPVSYALSGVHYRTDGTSAAAGGTEADGYEASGMSVRGAWQASPVLGFDARVFWAEGDAGIDGFPAPAFQLADTPERSQTEELTGVASASLALLDGRWRTTLAVNRTRTDRESLNPARTPALTFTARGGNDRVELVSVLDAAPGLQLLAGYERETARFRTASPSSFNPNPTPATARARTGALFIQAQASPSDWLTATLGVRHTDHDRFGDAHNLRATVAATLPGDATVLRAAIADGFKAPTLFQLYSDFGNQTLAPEEATSWEAGVEHSWFAGRLTGALTWFERATVNQIDFVSCFGVTRPICRNRPFGTYDNVARTRAEGLELVVLARPAPGLTLEASHTTLNARNAAGGNASFGRRLPRRPSSATVLSANWRPLEPLDLSASWSRTGAAFDNPANTVPLPAFELVSVRAAWQLGERLSLYGRIENAGDTRYQTTAGYGSPPRQVVLGLRADF